MASNFSSFQKGEIDEKSLVFEQISRINQIFSSFSASPDTVNAMAKIYNYMEMSQRGKAFALAVLTLEKLVQRHLAKIGFFESEKVKFAREKAYGTVVIHIPHTAQNNLFFNKEIKSKRFLSEDVFTQYDGLENICEYYGLLLDGIFGLPQFASDTKINLGAEDVGNPDEEVAVVESE